MISYRTGGPLPHPELTALVFFVIAGLFVLSYFFEDRSRWFRYFIAFCERFSVPSGRWMAFPYALMFFVLGIMILTK